MDGGSLFTLVVLMILGADAAHYDDESLLRSTLLKDYEFTIRPFRQVRVKVMLSLLSINVLDVPSQRLSVSGWLSFTWSDPRLSWDPDQYGGITDIFDTELVFWRPEIIVDNSVNNLGILESDKLLIRATSRGNMSWEPPGIYETHCDVDVTFYPFDTQVCVVEVTSWAQTMDEIDLHPEDAKIDLVDYEESGEWDVLGSWTERRLLVDGADTHTEIAFAIKLQRKPMYYITTILIPVMVTSILCVVVFLLPAQSGEKVGYALTILLTYTVMLTLVASYMPPTSKHTSVLGVYLTIILFIGVITTVLTVAVLHLHHRPDHVTVSTWLQFIIRHLLVPMTRWKPPTRSNTPDKPTGHPETNIFSVGATKSKIYPRTKYLENNKHNANGNSIENNRLDRQSDETVTSVANMTSVTSCADQGKIEDLEVDADSQLSENRRNRADEIHRFTWREFSVILDAVCLRILGLFVLVLTVVVLVTMTSAGHW